MKYVYQFVVIASLALVGACASQPYIYDGDKFDRGSGSFGQDPTDITEVTICYSKFESEPSETVRFAMDACGEFGKTARFESQSYLICPLVAPVAANYTCELPSSATGAASFFAD